MSGSQQRGDRGHCNSGCLRVTGARKLENLLRELDERLIRRSGVRTGQGHLRSGRDVG